MPDSDLAIMQPEYLAKLCMQRVNTQMHSWHEQVPWELFLEYVLPYAVLSEPRDTSLELLAKLEEYLIQFVRPGRLDTTALGLNYRAFDFTTPRITFHPAKPNKVNAYSPKQVIHDKLASCTGESVFLVYCLRVVGVPARVAGVPHWNRSAAICPQGIKSPACGNHNWVEVYLGLTRGWAFLDQNSLNGLNKGFFFPAQTNELIPGDYFHAVYASTWNRTAGNKYFPLVFDPNYKQVSAVDHTQFYHDLANNSNEKEIWMATS
ncbi:hypothetical protein BASA81_006400 [Batrachochytrium salamandrivorans]|nr:hypothetical protein BASA81_006400 [Batrachochytrium salamandrivorans]